MKICFVSFPLDRNLKAQTELVDRYGNCSPEDADYIVALGGDGFILKSLHDYLKINKPIFGMNFGSVGFLMNEYSIDNLDSRLAKAQLTKLRPLVMKTLTPTGQEVKAIAINEISIRREKYQAAKLKVIIDDEIRMEELVCDGVIVSTAAGSTGYNYSASGPIVPLGSNVMAMTAVSAYSPRHWKGGLLKDNAKFKGIPNELLLICFSFAFEFDPEPVILLLPAINKKTTSGHEVKITIIIKVSPCGLISGA